MPPKRKKRRLSKKTSAALEVTPSIEKKAKKKAKVEVDTEEESEKESKDEAKKVVWLQKKCARLQAKLRKSKSECEAAKARGQYLVPRCTDVY